MPYFAKGLLTNSGCASITATNSTVTVVHGLVVTPKPEDFNVILANNPCPVGAGVFWLSCVDACNFVINVDASPILTTTACFIWKVSVNV